MTVAIADVENMVRIIISWLVLSA